MNARKWIPAALAVVLALGLWKLAPKLLGVEDLQYEDTNGAENYALQVLTDDDILHNLRASASGGKTVERLAKHTHSVNTLHGVYDIAEFTRDSFHTAFTITLDYTLQRGNAKLVLCTDEEILCTFTPEKTQQSFTFDCADDIVHLRIAGEDCGFTVTYTVTAA